MGRFRWVGSDVQHGKNVGRSGIEPGILFFQVLDNVHVDPYSYDGTGPIIKFTYTMYSKVQSQQIHLHFL